MTMSGKNEALCRRNFEEIFTKGQFDTADEIFARNYTDHDPYTPKEFGKGPELVRKTANMYRTAFPDLKVTIEEMISDGDQVVTRWTAQGTHKGELKGVKPSNKKVTISGIQIDHVAAGKISESWTSWDALGMMEQIGAIPTPPKARIA
jgi:steroid delta-isomerase-like uncharacterized protein